MAIDIVASEADLKARIKALQQAMQAGVAKAEYTNFGSVTYKNMDEMRQALRQAEDDLRRLQGVKRPRAVRVTVKPAW